MSTSEDEKVAADLFKTEDRARAAAYGLIGNAVYRAKALFTPKPINEAPITAKFKSYKIALVPFPIVVKDRAGAYIPGGNYAPEGERFELAVRQFDHFCICVNNESPVSDIERWCKSVVARCKLALSKGVRFVILPELSFPNFWPGSKLSEFSKEDRRKRLTAMRSRLDVELQQLATQFRAVIIAGSYHDWETFENISPVYFPKEARSRFHRKITTAQVVEERIKIGGPEYPIYDYEGLRFAILVCSDAFDLNMFFAQTMASASGSKINAPDIFFVPSFYQPKDENFHRMKQACMQLSLATGQVVVFVSQSGSKQNSQAVFVAGGELKLSKTGRVYFADIAAETIARFGAAHEPLRRALHEILKPTSRTFVKV